MKRLQIRLFGQLEVMDGGRVLTGFATRKSGELFSYLALHRDRLHPRESLAGMLWGEVSEDCARRSLRTELWRLRKVLGPRIAQELLAVRGGRVGVRSNGDLWIDTAEFEDTLAPLRGAADELTAQDCGRMARALELYRGELLAGLNESWCLGSRERFREMYAASLEKLMRFHENRRAWGPAIVLGKRLLRFDPWNEPVHRVLMLCFWRQGNRVAALRQYRRCAELLRDEFDVEPMPETAALYSKIRE